MLHKRDSKAEGRWAESGAHGRAGRVLQLIVVRSRARTRVQPASEATGEIRGYHFTMCPSKP
ncbi:hypothetical protein PSAB6_420031 [Paraburkholderia sabiae]|nr:hypothetical protein PSAB6_420031 [Paraburkholderia sabiae]